MASEKQKQDFMEIYNAAKSVGIKHPEIIAAQWALESGWGKSVTGKYNYWGVKAGNGDPNNSSPGSVHWTTENIGGRDVRVRQKFKDYESLQDAMQDRKEFTSIRGGRYDKAGYSEARTPAQAADALQRGNYATDPRYAEKLKSVMKSVGIDPDKENSLENEKEKSLLNKNDYLGEVNDLVSRLKSGDKKALSDFTNQIDVQKLHQEILNEAQAALRQDERGLSNEGAKLNELDMG